MSLPLLPRELLLGITDEFECARDINALAQTHTRLDHILNPYLYWWDVRHDQNRALVWAIERGQTATARKALEGGTDPQATHWWVTPELEARIGHENLAAMMKVRKDVRNPDFHDMFIRTPLMQAAHYGRESIVALLLATKGVIPDAKTPQGQSALSLAAEEGHVGVVKLLLASERVDINFKSADGQTPLSRAAQNGHEEVVRVLLATGRITSDNGSRSLRWLATLRDGSIAKLLLKTEDIDPDVKDKNGRTPLSWAAESGNREMVKLLLAAGADPNSADDTGRTTLSRAAQYGTAAVDILLAAQASPDFRDHEGRTPLSWAAEQGEDANVKRLLATKDVDPDSKDSHGRTPLSWAAGARLGDKSTAPMRLLLAAGVNPDSKDSHGRTPLSWAAGARFGDKSTAPARLLLAAGVNPDSRDLGGRTPLSWAAGVGFDNAAMVELLLATEGVDPESRDATGRTPLTWAHDKLDWPVIELLRPYGGMSSS